MQETLVKMFLQSRQVYGKLRKEIPKLLPNLFYLVPGGFYSSDILDNLKIICNK